MSKSTINEESAKAEYVQEENKRLLDRSIKVLNFYKHRNRSNWQTQENTIGTLRSARLTNASQVIDSFTTDDEVLSVWPEDVLPPSKDATIAEFSVQMLYMTAFEVIAIAHYYISSYKDKYQDINNVHISEGKDPDGDYTGSFRVSYVDTHVDMTIGYYEMGRDAPLILNYNATLPAELILARVESLLHQKAVKLLFSNLTSSRPEAQ